MASKLKTFSLPKFSGGYNSFPASKAQVKDNEIPYGINVEFDDNGSAAKRSGKTAYGPEIVANPWHGVVQDLYHQQAACRL